MDDDTLDAIDASDFWLDDTALDADSMPVQSLDFGLLLGDVVPRDGLQRPLLTTGSPTHAHVPRRASKQPINVTHVHQTVVQHFGPVPAACPATVAEGTSGLSCLESTLAVPQGSVYKPASRWHQAGQARLASSAIEASCRLRQPLRAGFASAARLLPDCTNGGYFLNSYISPTLGFRLGRNFSPR